MTRKEKTAGFALAALLLSGMWAAAQSAKTTTTGKNSGNLSRAHKPGTSAANGQKNGAASGASSVNEGKKPNPLYEDKGSGTNPLYEGHDAMAKGKGSHGVVQYKEPEDMTTRYRPGNNKTTKTQSKGKTGSSAIVEYKDGDDTTTRTRPAGPK
jgi:hypothetical protein